MKQFIGKGLEAHRVTLLKNRNIILSRKNVGHEEDRT
jgi:hypothetical protein